MTGWLGRRMEDGRCLEKEMDRKIDDLHNTDRHTDYQIDNFTQVHACKDECVHTIL